MDLQTDIVAVTVYQDRAQVVRRGTITLEPGSHRLEVGPLPVHLVVESVRARGEGTAQARLLGVDVIQRFYEKPPAEAVEELERRLDELQDEEMALKRELKRLGTQIAFLAGLGDTAQPFVRGVAFGKTDVETGERLLQFALAGLEQAHARQGEIAVRRREIKREREKLERELEKVRSARPTMRYAAAVEVEVLSPGDLTLEVVYQVTKASWQSLYDLRLPEEDGDHLELTYLGQVVQRTGEDWPEVELTLSTARPALAATLPELKPWYLRPYVERRRPVAAAPKMAKMAKGAILEEEITYAEEEEYLKAPPSPAPMEVLTAEVQSEGATVTFRLPRPANIPADGSSHKVTVAEAELTAELDYITTPRLAQAVYRRAKVTNSSELTLLPGKANLFHGGEYVGTTELERVAPGEEVELYLGVDDRLPVERELVRHDVDKRILGGKRRLHYAYKITVQNLTAQEARVVVKDQIPVPQHEAIKVRLDDADPRPDKQDDLGIMEWHLTLPPQGKQIIRYEFTVEHPPEMEVVGLP